MPPNAVVGGTDEDGATIYVGRAGHNGDMLVCKVVPTKKIGFISKNGKTVAKHKFEVLCGGNLAWAKCQNHVLPESAVLCGRTTQNNLVYIGRGHYKGHLIIGKVGVKRRYLYIAYRGEEQRLDSFEILVEQKCGMTQYAPSCPAYNPGVSTPAQQPVYVQPPAYDVWVNASPGYTPPDAVYAGHDTDMAPLQVFRVYYEGIHIPGKAAPSRGCAYIAHAGREIVQSSYEVLIGQSKYHWVPGCDGSIAPGAVEAGRDHNGEVLYVGRANYCGSLTPGKLQQSQRCLHIPFGGQEVLVNSYEILLRSNI